jgi:hypothetical protein
MNSKERCSRSEIMAIEAPEYTKTWHPIPHSALIESLDLVLKEKGVGIKYETYSTRTNGSNLFGTWVLDIEKDNKNIQIGFRNSISKSYAVGICAGTFIIVCSNMQFKGDYIEFRRHTGRLDYDELKSLTSRAFDQVVDSGYKAIEWHSSLNQSPLDGDRFKCATYDAFTRGIIAPQKFSNFIEAYEMEQGLSGESTLYEFHGAITRMQNKLNLFTVDSRSRKLADLCDQYRIQ